MRVGCSAIERRRSRSAVWVSASKIACIQEMVVARYKLITVPIRHENMNSLAHAVLSCPPKHCNPTYSRQLSAYSRENETDWLSTV
jgi:hypothetical protein